MGKRKGHKLSAETKNKIAIKAKERWRLYKLKGGVPDIGSRIKGKHLSNERRKQISDNQKKLWQSPEYRERMLKQLNGNQLPWDENRLKKREDSAKEHSKAILEEMENYEKAGFKCFPTGALGIPNPDFIAIKNDKAFAVEVEFRRIDPDRYTNCPYYDDIIWIKRDRYKK